MKSELDLIEWIRKKIPRRLQGGRGIGDDTAVLAGKRNKQWLFTTDSLVEGVDFIRNEVSPELVGRKALAVNLSDIAAMGGEPYACVISLGIPPRFPEAWVEKFYAGFIRLAGKYNTLCAGGDISRAREFFAAVTVWGSASSDEIVMRSGARVGDCVMLTGALGGSILKKHLLFEPRIREARFLAKKFHPTSMIDLSDGLVQDLEHILKASRCAASLDLAQIPVSKDAKKLAAGNPAKALERALTDGEDFELLFTLPLKRKEELELVWKKHFPKVKLSFLGRIQKGKAGIIWTKGLKPCRLPALKRKGYSHF